MAVSRSRGRNVHIYLENEPTPIGGLKLDSETLHITHVNFYHFIEILVFPVMPDELLGLVTGHLVQVVDRDTSRPLICDATLLQPGSYILRTSHPSVSLQVNNEPYIDRVISHSVTGRDDIFRERLRLRDSGCVISGKRNRLADDGIWAGFKAAHVWPLHKGQEWINQGIYRWITDADPLDPDHGALMNSPQNGMILDAALHALFDKYLIGIDPDDGYKVIVFAADSNSIAGRYLSPSVRQNGLHGVRNTLLRWHLRQCVFANMRGAGEPVWDYDDTSGDVVGRLLREDTGGYKLGEEIATRLALTEFLEI